ncbi:OLC1v1000579C3, partial [Oldenlandia corymbosa var. corymbosa]
CIQSALDDLSQIFPHWYWEEIEDLKRQLSLVRSYYGLREANVCQSPSSDDGPRLEKLQQILVLDGATLEGSSTDELLGMVDSLIQNWVYGMIPSYLIPNLSKSLEFLKNFIHFAEFRGLELRQMEEMLVHVQGLVVDAASLNFKFSDLLMDRIQPVEYHVCEIYVRVLEEASKSSQGSNVSTPGGHRIELGMVDSLIFLLLGLLLRGTNHIYMFDQQMHTLYEALRFLTTTLRVHHDQLDERFEKMKDLIGVLICESAMAVCYLCVRKYVSQVVERLQQLFFDVEEKYKILKETLEAPRAPVLRSESCFPQTNLLGFVDFVLAKMESLNLYEPDSVAALEKNKLETIHGDLSFLRNSLVSFMGRHDQNEKLQDLWSRIAMVAYETEFVIDSLIVGGGIQSFVGMLNTIIEQIKLVKTEASEVSHRVGKITKAQNIAKPHKDIPGIIPGFNEPVVGLDDEVQKIIDRLRRGTKHLDVVSIVGMPGLGKTTLAKKVYRDPSIAHHFHVRAWSTISQVYNKRSLLLEILMGLDNGFAERYSNMSEYDLADAIRRHLKGKMYLLVLDDVWDIEAWYSLQISFPDDAKGSRILLTSRNESVALQLKSQSQPHHLRMLTNDESLELFQMKLYSIEGYPSEFHVRAKAIAQCCKGLPLMILIVSGLLSRMEPSRWEEVERSLKKSSAPTMDLCKETLELSYHHLPDYLKPCFLYFGVFKEDQHIRVRELLWLWIAEGFVRKVPEECIEDVAEGYLTELIQKNLVMIAKRGSEGKVNYCMLHDLLHEFCIEQSIGDHFLQRLRVGELGTCTEPNKSYRLHISCRTVHDFAEPRVVFPYLRTLFVEVDEGNWHEHYWYGIMYKFSRSKLLRVLSLRGMRHFHAFPSVIQHLGHLKYLTLSIRDEQAAREFIVPSSIANLSYLDTLIFYGYIGLCRVLLPNTLWKMKHLRHLYVVGSKWRLPSKDDDPEGLSILENLKSFSTVELSSRQATKEVLGRFPNIHRLKCKLHLSEGVCEFIALDFLSHLESLSIYGSYSREICNDYFQFPQNLKKLTLGGLSIPWSKISAIDRLPNLEVLKLGFLSFIGEYWNMGEGTFPSLRFLKIFAMAKAFISFTIKVSENYHFLSFLPAPDKYCHGKLYSKNDANVDQVNFDDEKKDHFCRRVSQFLKEIEESILPGLKDLQQSLCDDYSLLQNKSSSPTQARELLGMLDTLIQSLWYVRDEKLLKSFGILKTFIRFAIFRGLEQRQMEDVSIHIERIKPSEYHVCGIYVGVLKEASKLSVSTNQATPESRSLILEMVDSLIFLLLELSFRGTGYVDIFHNQMYTLYEGLRLLRAVLREHQDKSEELYDENMQNSITVLICEAAIIVCYLFVKKDDNRLDTPLQHLFFEVEKKINLFKKETEQEAPTYPLKLVSCFPQTNLLGFIDSVLEKMESHNLYEPDSVVASEKNMLVTIQDDLAFVRSLLVKFMRLRAQNGKVQALCSRVAVAAYETEFVIDSLVVGGTIQSLCGTFNTIMEHMEIIKIEALEVSRSVGEITENHNFAKTHMNIPLAEKIPGFNEPVVGMDDEVQNIIDRLRRGTKQLDVVSIVGMAGLGKTTLVKKVFSKMNEYDLADAIRRCLKGKTYLIVLDDVWDSEAWESLKISFPDDMKGSRILLTSRNENVAQIKQQSQPYCLRSLTDDESWELFQIKIRFEENHPLQLRAHGKAISQRCKGLPLMIVIVAGLLSSMETSRWEEVEESLKNSLATTLDKCKETLELSYNHLPDYLKPCFLYFATHKEDQRIRVQELSWLWIAEGFVKKTPKASIEDVAEGYMMDLIQRNLVMIAERGAEGKVKFCILHDLIHEFCLAKSMDDHFLHRLHGSELGTSMEHNVLYRFHAYSKRVEDFAESMLVFPSLRTLFIVVEHETMDARPWYNILYKFSRSKLLRVLDLSRMCRFHFFPSIMQQFGPLKYLTLTIEGEEFIVPPSIANLSTLETLTFYGQHYYSRVLLPNTVWKMKNIMHLHIVNSYWELPADDHPEDISILENLQSFSIVGLFSRQATKEVVIRRFPNIRRFKCELRFSEGVFEIIALDFLSKLESLCILGVGFPLEIRNDHYQFPHNLRKLTLQRLYLPWSKISMIDRLPKLEVLKLQYKSFIGENWYMGEGTFPKLRFLKLDFLDLVRWTDDSDDNFPCLEKLVLKSCLNLKELPSCLAEIPTMQMIEVSRCNNATDSLKHIQETQLDFGNVNLKIRIHMEL